MWHTESKKCAREGCDGWITRGVKTPYDYAHKNYCNGSCSRKCNPRSIEKAREAKKLLHTRTREPYTKKCPKQGCLNIITERLNKDGKKEGWVRFTQQTYCAEHKEEGRFIKHEPGYK